MIRCAVNVGTRRTAGRQQIDLENIPIGFEVIKLVTSGISRDAHGVRATAVSGVQNKAENQIGVKHSRGGTRNIDVGQKH
jgi:hypothetical protein